MALLNGSGPNLIILVQCIRNIYSIFNNIYTGEIIQFFFLTNQPFHATLSTGQSVANAVMKIACYLSTECCPCKAHVVNHQPSCSAICKFYIR